MAVPKRKTSKSKSSSRKAQNMKKPIARASTSQSGAPALPHRVCPSTGTYKGRQVISVEVSE
ncbi:MAG: 50S ribosomal protein L32 [Kiritimatiellaceae bacterium]|nr:50S ribosomal protein L32 [Kiritimatiellaceae bacterium]